MGPGIAQLAATCGHPVVLYDISEAARNAARDRLDRVLARLVEKGRLASDEARGIGARIHLTAERRELSDAAVVIEAIVEDLAAKRELLGEVETLLAEEALLATNTSSLSVTAIAAGCARPQRCIGMHFFNPAPLMPLVEVVPGLETEDGAIERALELGRSWGKTTVVAKDTPGFIVNRIARPFYSEALRLLDEGVADVATIDWAMRDLGGFRMGPFELMDLIGNDVNFTVTETMFRAFYGEPRYRPSFTQQRLVEAGRLGRKTGRGYYDYREGAVRPEPRRDEALGKRVLQRILALLINEAADAVFWNVATPADADLAMTKGVNYPKGLLAWGDEIGPDVVAGWLDALRDEYGEERYRVSPLLRRAARSGVALREAAR